MLNHHHRHIALFADVQNEACDVFRLLLVHARHHFVKQQQLWLHGQCPPKLHPLLQPIRQRANRQVTNPLDFEKFNNLFGGFPRADFCVARTAPKQRRAKNACVQPRVHAGQDVVDHGLVLEHSQVLKSTRHAAL